MRIVEFLLYPGVLTMDITGPLEVFNTATLLLKNIGEEKEGYSYIFTSKDAGPVRTTSGLALIADSSFSEKTYPDMFIVPGGSADITSDLFHDYLTYVKDIKSRTKRVVSVCKGAFILAETGMLHHKKVTTHWMNAEELKESYPDVTVESEAIFLKDGNIYTSAGVTSGIDLALSLVEEDYGRSLALEVSRYLVLYYKRPGNQSQFSSPLSNQAAAGERFQKLYNWLSENLSRNISVEEMAEFSAMSVRNFARVFKKETGRNPGKFFENMKLERAREIIGNSCKSLEEIAVISGFGREERLRRAFLRRYGLTPSQYRLHFSE